MTQLAPVRINGDDYGDGRVVIEAFRNWVFGQDWAVPAWEEMGLGELEGPFPTRIEAEAALASVDAAILAEYGYLA